MKKLFESKKVKLILTGVLLLGLAVGTSYAWWTASVSKTTKITMGKLDIGYTIDNSIAPDDWEPGFTVDMDGTITNNGVDAFMTVNSASKIDLIGDDTYVDAGQAVDMNLAPSADVADPDAFWFQSKTDGQVYLMLEKGATAHITTDAYLDGDFMDNSYQGKTLKLVAKVDATQVVEGAMKAEFGVGFDDLEAYAPTTRAFTSNVDAIAKLREVLDRAK